MLTLLLEQIGKGRILVEGFQVAILGYGSIVQNCVAAQISLLEHGVSVTVADARFCKPLDRDLIRKLVRDHEVLITIEEGAIGGFSAHVAHFLSLEGLLDGGLKVGYNSKLCALIGLVIQEIMESESSVRENYNRHLLCDCFHCPPC